MILLIMYVSCHWMLLPIELSVLLKSAEFLAVAISESKVKPGWIYFVKVRTIIFNLKSFNYFSS